MQLIAAFALAASSCNMISGNGNVRTEKRNTGNFNSVKTSGSIDVEISSGDNYAVSVEDDDNLLPYVVTEVNGGTLDIHYKDGTSITNDHAKVYVTAPSLDKVVCFGFCGYYHSRCFKKSAKN